MAGVEERESEVGEVGELSGIFQWKGEVPRGLPDWEEEERQHLGEELSDVLLYLVRLSDICGVDLGQAALRKLQLNAIKYPAKLCKGSSKKHTQVNNNNNSNNSSVGVDVDVDVDVQFSLRRKEGIEIGLSKKSVKSVIRSSPVQSDRFGLVFRIRGSVLD
ncbi:hypothetical protein TEA_014930 [Camellia sinensis var. sinensis]|uniref:dCTP pyrophosphatase 1 n=1 Tax=Camellia sinensis var. sinensis TaxID=542762 RepID=A0A4S4DJ57_CAMSN|nr:hypothetical protein TEA_014930 [Camellia sinensis var. sinensis]